MRKVVFFFICTITSFNLIAQCGEGYSFKKSSTIINGEFSEESNGISSQLTFRTQVSYMPGIYMIAKDGGTGNEFLQVNQNGNKVFWEQTISIDTDKDYYIFFHAKSLSAAKYGRTIIKITFNDKVHRFIKTPEINNAWQQFFSVWKADGKSDKLKITLSTYSNKQEPESYFGVDNLQVWFCDKEEYVLVSTDEELLHDYEEKTHANDGINSDNQNEEETEEIILESIKEMTMGMLSELEPGEHIYLDHVLFRQSTAELTDNSYESLDAIVDFLHKNQYKNIKIIGHTDNVGHELPNYQLSVERANSVRNYVLAQGVSPNRVMYEGKGETDPMADNSTEEGKQLNRRVEILLLP